MLVRLYRLHLLPQYGCDIASTSVVDVCLQVHNLVLWYTVDETETQYLHLEELRLGYHVAQVVGKVVLVMRPRTIRHTHAIVEILDGVASEARGDDGAIASLAVLVAL